MVIARLRNRTFASLDEAVLAVRKCNAACNARPFKKRRAAATRCPPRSRPPSCARCPTSAATSPNECATARSTSTPTSSAPKNRYPVPHRYVGCKVDLRVGESTLSIYHAGERIAAHRLKPAYVVNDYSTDEAHMPDSFLKPDGTTPASKAGRSESVPTARPLRAAYSPAPRSRSRRATRRSALNLSKKHGEDRLEAACAGTAAAAELSGCRRLKAILDRLDRGAAEGANGNDGADAAAKGHVRGAVLQG